MIQSFEYSLCIFNLYPIYKDYMIKLNKVANDDNRHGNGSEENGQKLQLGSGADGFPRLTQVGIDDGLRHLRAA
jgi:hypothetical protein